MFLTALWCSMWGRGLRRRNGACSTLCQFSVTSLTTHNQIGLFWCCFPSGWVCVHSRPLWVSPMNSPVRLGVSPAAASTPTGVFSQCFEALFSHAGTLGCVLCHPVHQLLLCWPAAALPTLLHNPPPCWVCQLLPCGKSPPPAAHLWPSYQSGWMLLLYLLGVGLPYSSIFCQFWLFFVLKLFLSFFCLCEEAQCVYLHLHLGWKSIFFDLIYFLLVLQYKSNSILDVPLSFFHLQICPV